MDEVRHTTEPEVDLAPGREGAKLKGLSTCRDGKFQTRSSPGNLFGFASLRLGA